MSRRLASALALVAIIASAESCGRQPDTAPPVATPSVRLARSDVPVGSPLEMSYRFVVAPDAPAFGEDDWVFVHFLDSDNELMWTDDHQPPTPTRQWKAGSTVDYQRTMFIPKFPYVGETRVEVGLFSPKSGNRVPLAGETRGQRSYKVASFNLRLQTDNVFVVFKEGWHEAEVDEASGVEWQWSKKDATLTFRNPRKDSILYLQMDQPVAAFSEPQHVDVRLGSNVIDSFDLPPGNRELRRVALTAGQLGTADALELAISVDKTFVPAAVPGLKSSDSRELGIRVFRVFVQPK